MSCALGNDPKGCGCNCSECFAYLEQGMKVNRFLVNGCNQDSAKLMASILSLQEQMKGVMSKMALFDSRDKMINDVVTGMSSLVEGMATPQFVELKFNDSYTIPAMLYKADQGPIQLTAQISDLYGDGSEISSMELVDQAEFAGTIKSLSIYVPNETGKQQKYTATSGTFTSGSVTFDEVLTASEVTNDCPAISGLYVNILFDLSGIIQFT